MTLVDDVRIVDADTHMTERHDLFTERAPKGYEDRVPMVTDVDGVATWVLEGHPLGPARPGGVIDVNGDKHAFAETRKHGIDWVHRGAWDVEERLKVMDETGIDTQVVYPNAVGIGGQNIANATNDPEVRRLCVELYNDAMAEVQEQTDNRMLPMPVLPAWSIEECAKEAERCADLGFRGVNMTSDPQDAGSVDLAHPDWDALWEVCADRDLPVHFHIGASQTSLTFFGKYFWPSLHENVKPAVGGAMLFLNNARVIINSVYAGIFDRHPELKMVSVESGIGWIPFILETMDYEILENAPEQAKELNRMPSEYFEDHWWATFWFEKHQGDLQGLIEKVGVDNVMFETDYPHPTCLYPDPLGTVGEVIGELDEDIQRKVLSENAISLYRI